MCNSLQQLLTIIVATSDAASAIPEFDFEDDFDGERRTKEVFVPLQPRNVRGAGPSLADALGVAPMRCKFFFGNLLLT